MNNFFLIDKYLKTTLPLFAIAVFLLSCENDINEVKALDAKGVNSEEAINIESYLSVGGKLKGRLTAPLMITDAKDSSKRIFPKTLHVIFYNDSTGLPDNFLFSKYGVYYEQLGKVMLRDSVIGTNLGGDTLRTKELWWDRNTERIYSSSPTLFTQVMPFNITRGDSGFNSKQDFSDIVFFNTNRSVMQMDSTTSF